MHAVKKLSGIVVIVLAGAASAGQTAVSPRGLNLYLDAQYDTGLLDGPNQTVDFTRLTDAAEADQYALELVATTKYSVLRKAFLALPQVNRDKAQNLWEEGGKRGRQNWTIKSMGDFLAGLDPVTYVRVEATLGNFDLRALLSTNGNFGGNYVTSPLRTQQYSISRSWSILRQAAEPHGSFMTDLDDMGCHQYAMTVRGPTPIWSRKRCDTAYQVFPNFLQGLKQRLGRQ